MLASADGLVLKQGLSRSAADELMAGLPDDGTVMAVIQREIDSWVAVLMGYRPGSRGRLRVALQSMSRLSTEEIIHFLASIPIALKSGIDRKTAEAIKDALERQGGIVEIRPHRESYQGSVPDRKRSALPVESSADDASHDQKRVLPHAAEKPHGVSPPVLCSQTPAPAIEHEVPYPLVFTPPEGNDAITPPPLCVEYPLSEHSAEPYQIRFTVPSSSLPPVPVQHAVFSVPERTDSGAVFPLYLHSVSAGDRDRVSRILEETLGFPPSRTRELIRKAPVTLFAYQERINALVALRGLSEKGVPVSLIPAPDGNAVEPDAKSFLGWLNGNR